LGEEYFKYELEPYLKPDGVKKLKELVDAGATVVLVSQGLEQVMRPLARHLGVKWVIANRMEFRDGFATGRLLDPVIRPGDLCPPDWRRSQWRARCRLAGGGLRITQHRKHCMPRWFRRGNRR